MAVKTILKIVQEVCYKINEPAPSSLFGSTDPNSLQWLHLVYDAGEIIRDETDYPTLKQKYSFATVASQKYYPLPGNFWRLLLNTQWDDTNQWAMFGPELDGGIAARDKGTTLNDTQYTFRVSGAAFDSVSQDSFDVSGGYIEISPTPADVRTLSIEYIGANWFYPTQWVSGTAYSSGDFVSANRNIYKCTANVDTSATRPTGETSSDGASGAWQLWRGLYNEIGADTDYPIIDPHTVNWALRAAWKANKGLDDTYERTRAKQAMSNAVGRFQGKQGLKADGDSLYEFPWISEDYVASGF